MNQYKQFIFEPYEFDEDKKVLSLHYSMDGKLDLTETYHFDFEFVAYDKRMLDRAFQTLFFMAGVSYYKMFVPPEIVIRQGELDPFMAEFFSKTYQRGLGEFFYVNQLDPHTPIPFPPNKAEVRPLAHPPEYSGLLVGIGGGKDSLVGVELLRGRAHVATWSVNHRPQLTPLVERIALKHYWVERTWDPYLFEHKARGGLNGHVPISALFACVGAVIAILTGRQQIVVSNESSASEPSLTYQDVPINHQYSKSLEFEKDFQTYLAHVFGPTIIYYSFLRPLSELRIAEIFSLYFDKYKDVFSSCNRGFVHGSDHIVWCGTCPKCAFAFLVLAPFIERGKLETLFGGKNLLLDPALEKTYQQLLGIKGDKPLDCVGEVKESRAAMQLAQSQYSELLKYHFDLPDNYNFRALGPSSMPSGLLRIIFSLV
jgi:hypothetical protein